MIIGIDFDGTIVERAYPNIGAPVPGAIEAMKCLIEQGHKIILWTTRDRRKLRQAVVYVEMQGIELLGVNKIPDQDWNESPKPHCDVLIDDTAYGCPLIHPSDGRRPYVDWSAIDLIGLGAQ